MRVLFLTLYPDSAASPRYRVRQFIPYLEAHGVSCTVASAVSAATYDHRLSRRPFVYHLEETRRRLFQILSARDYHVVVLQKALTSISVRPLMPVFRRRVPRYLYDIDDAVHLAVPNPVPSRWAWLSQADQIREIARWAQCVLAGNAWLADAVHNAGGVAEVFPTVVDTDRFRPALVQDPQFRVGWIGSPSTAHALRAIHPVLSNSSEIELEIMGAGEEHGLANVQTCPWNLEAEVPFLQRLSVGLMPLPRDEWSRGKCALKALQYMACGVPCVATPFGAVTSIIEHGVNGMFAATHDEWRAALEQLRDAAMRRRLGNAARETVEARFSLRYASPRMLAILEQHAGKGLE